MASQKVECRSAWEVQDQWGRLVSLYGPGLFYDMWQYFMNVSCVYNLSSQSLTVWESGWLERLLCIIVWGSVRSCIIARTLFYYRSDKNDTKMSRSLHFVLAQIVCNHNVKFDLLTYFNTDSSLHIDNTQSAHLIAFLLELKEQLILMGMLVLYNCICQIPRAYIIWESQIEKKS